jgi:small-conductance mechanosensitive channel
MSAVVPLRVVVAGVLVVWAVSVRGQDVPAPAAPAPSAIPSPAPEPPSAMTPEAPVVDEAPLVYFNRTIIVFRVPLFGVRPEGRARRSAEVLGQLLDRQSAGIVTVQAEPQGNLILLDGELAFIIVAGDADRLRGESLAALTERTVATLRLVIAETREIRDRSRLLRSALYAIGGTLVFLAVVSVVLFVRRLLLRRIGVLTERAAAATHVGGAQLVTADRLLPIVRQFVSAFTAGVIAIVAYEWLSYVLAQFPYTRPWGERLLAFFAGAGVQIGQGLLGALPGLTMAVAILLAARAVIGLVTPFFDRAARGYLSLHWLDRDTAQPTKRLFTIGVWLFALVMAYPYLPGSDSEAFKGISVLLGLMVTFGGSSLFGQAASGLILMYSRTLRLGEYVRIDTHEGTVTEMGSFTTKIRTGLGEELTLPNALLLGTVVKNYSRAVKGHGYIVDTTVTIGYDTPWRQVEAMLTEAARRTSGVLASPPPRVFQTALSDFYPEYRLVCQAIPSEPRPRAEVLASLHANIQDVFNEHGVQIMSPHYLADPAAAKVVPKAQWYAAPAKPPETS